MGTKKLLCSVLSATSQADADKVEAALEHVCANNNELAQFCVLGVVRYSKPELTPRALELIAELARSSDESVRFFALGICAAASHHQALGQFVVSGWKAPDANTLSASWNGSFALRVAAQSGLIDAQEACTRICFNHLGFAALELGQGVAQKIALSLQKAVECSLELGALNDLPKMTFSTSQQLGVFPSLASVDEPWPQNDIVAQMDRASETEKEFYARQDRAKQKYERFVETFTSQGAHLVHDDLTLDGMFAILDAAPEISESMFNQLLQASDYHLRLLRHSAFQISFWSAVKINHSKSGALLQKLFTLSPVSFRLQAITSLPDEVDTLWRFADNAICETICRQRLFTLANDKEISLEVLAALQHGKGTFVVEIVDELLATGEPAKICRAITLAGFCDENIHAANVLQKFTNTYGFIGTAAKAAQSAYNRNQWAYHWFNVMKSAETPVDFWAASVLFTKVVDARFILWDRTTSNDVFKRFWPTVSNSLQNRIEKWHGKRNKNLFGGKQPAANFLGKLLFL